MKVQSKANKTTSHAPIIFAEPTLGQMEKALIAAKILLTQSITGYWKAVNFSTNETIWDDPASEDAYDYEFAVCVAYDLIK